MTQGQKNLSQSSDQGEPEEPSPEELSPEEPPPLPLDWEPCGMGTERTTPMGDAPVGFFDLL